MKDTALQNEVRQLVSYAADGLSDQSQRKRLETLLGQSDELVDSYVAMISLESSLEQLFGQSLLEPLESVSAGSPDVAPGQGRNVRFASLRMIWGFVSGWKVGTLLLLTAFVVASLVALAWRAPSSIVDLHDVVWTDTHYTIGDAVTGKWLCLQEGSVQIAFRSGALVSVRGPAKFRATKTNRAELAFGTVDIHVPPQAQGFTIDNGELSVIDLGTNFCFSADLQGKKSIHVMRGKVQVLHREAAQFLELSAGDMVRENNSKKLEVVRLSEYAPRVTGGTQVLEEHVQSLGYGAFNQDGKAVLFLERHAIALPYDVTVNASQAGTYHDFNAEPMAIEQGTVVDSYLLHCAPKSDRHTVKGSLRFSRPILGVICVSDRLNATNDSLGNRWTLQCEHPQRGLESAPDSNSDVLTISPDRKRIRFLLRTEMAIDQIRILIASDSDPIETKFE